MRANKAKAALLEAAGATKAEAIPSPQLVFPAVDDTRLRREIDRAQRPMALIDYRLQGLQRTLEAARPTAKRSPNRVGGRGTTWPSAASSPNGPGRWGTTRFWRT